MGEIETLRRNIGLHKNMEKQLAKRSHIAQKQITELKKEQETLAEEKGKMSRGLAIGAPDTFG